MTDDPRRLRCSGRLGVVLPARCRTRRGLVDRVVMTDLSEGGCRLEGRALILRKGDLVVISPGVIEGIRGEVRWVKGNKAGIAFIRPLYGPVVEHIHRHHARFLPDDRPAPPIAPRPCRPGFS